MLSTYTSNCVPDFSRCLCRFFYPHVFLDIRPFLNKPACKYLQRRWHHHSQAVAVCLTSVKFSMLRFQYAFSCCSGMSNARIHHSYLWKGKILNFMTNCVSRIMLRTEHRVSTRANGLIPLKHRFVDLQTNNARSIVSSTRIASIQWKERCWFHALDEDLQARAASSELFCKGRLNKMIYKTFRWFFHIVYGFPE